MNNVVLLKQKRISSIAEYRPINVIKFEFDKKPHILLQEILDEINRCATVGRWREQHDNYVLMASAAGPLRQLQETWQKT